MNPVPVDAAMTRPRMIHWDLVPDKNRADDLRRYVERGMLPDAFMCALLANNARSALEHGNQTERGTIGQWLEWFGKNLPAECWGGPDAIYAWSDAKLDGPARELMAIEANIRHHEALLDQMREQRDQLLARTPVTCETSVLGKGCGATFGIGELTYIATHSYVRPYSCHGGDYWVEGEGMFVCPSCGNRNRLYDRQHIQRLKRHFKETVDEHCD